MLRRRLEFKRSSRRPLWAVAIAVLGMFGLPVLAADDAKTLELRLRSRSEVEPGKGQYQVVEKSATWDAKETAIIVCDMWDAHHCLNAVRREKEMAPRMEKVLAEARSRGVTLIHAPSSCMAAYKEHPARKHAVETPRAKTLPKDIGQWCNKIPAEEKGTYPIDQTDGGEDDDPAEHHEWVDKLVEMKRDPKAPWKAQIDVLTIKPSDYISDEGAEVWSILEDRGLKNVILLGVHTNMCVLGRPFGLRQMAKNGKNVVLMRDMTDTMYNPERPPYVSHFTGTDLIVEHTEKFVCPTITSDQLVGGVPFRFLTDPRPRVVFVIAEDEYKTEVSLPIFASTHLAKAYHVEYALGSDRTRDDIPGMNMVSDADLVLLSARRRVLPKAQVDLIRAFVAAGKPLVGIRTASHAFSPNKSLKTKVAEGHVAWGEFDADVLGGSYTNHRKVGPITTITVAPGADSSPILKGVDLTKFESPASLYMVTPIAKTATALLIGTIPDFPAEPIAWVNAPTTGGRVFYTSLGHMEDFKNPQFQRLLLNGLNWALGDRSPVLASAGTAR